MSNNIRAITDERRTPSGFLTSGKMPEMFMVPDTTKRNVFSRQHESHAHLTGAIAWANIAFVSPAALNMQCVRNNTWDNVWECREEIERRGDAYRKFLSNRPTHTHETIAKHRGWSDRFTLALADDSSTITKFFTETKGWVDETISTIRAIGNKTEQEFAESLILGSIYYQQFQPYVESSPENGILIDHNFQNRAVTVIIESGHCFLSSVERGWDVRIAMELDKKNIQRFSEIYIGEIRKR